MNKIDSIYLKLIMIGSIRIRNLCDLKLYDEARAEAEHLHEIPGLVGDQVCHGHFFYLRVHRMRFLEAMNAKATPESLDQIRDIYGGLWKRLEAEVLAVFGEEPSA